MSACSIIHGRDCVHMLTDGASWAGDMTVDWIGSKVSTLLDGRAAWSARGSGLFLDRLDCLQRGFDVAHGFDDLIGILPAALQIAFGPLDQGCGDGEVTVIGWSESRERAEAWTIATHDEALPADLPGYVPYVAQEIFPAMARPGVDSLSTTLGLDQQSPTLDEFLALDIEPAAIRLLEAQRRTLIDEPPIRGYAVGGFGELTTAARDGIERRTIATWPDRVGEVVRL